MSLNRPTSTLVENCHPHVSAETRISSFQSPNHVCESKANDANVIQAPAMALVMAGPSRPSTSFSQGESPGRWVAMLQFPTFGVCAADKGSQQDGKDEKGENERRMKDVGKGRRKHK